MSLQSQNIPDSMTKKGKKKARIVEYDSDEEDAEVAPIAKAKIVYEGRGQSLEQSLNSDGARFTTCW